MYLYFMYIFIFYLNPRFLSLNAALRGIRARDRSCDASPGILLRPKIHVQSTSALLLRQATLHDTQRCKVLFVSEQVSIFLHLTNVYT